MRFVGNKLKQFTFFFVLFSVFVLIDCGITDVVSDTVICFSYVVI